MFCVFSALYMVLNMQVLVKISLSSGMAVKLVKSNNDRPNCVY